MRASAARELLEPLVLSRSGFGLGLAFVVRLRGAVLRIAREKSEWLPTSTNSG